MSFGSGGEITYNVTVDARQAAQQLQSVGQQFTQLGQSTQQATQEIQKAPAAIDNVSKSTQSFGSVLKENVLGLANVASGVINLVRGYTQLERAQNTLNRAEQTAATMRNRITGLQGKLNDAIAKYGANSQEAITAQANLTNAQQKYGTQLQKVDIMQTQLNERTADFYVNTLTGGIQTVSGVVSVLSNLSKSSQQVATSTGDMSDAIGQASDATTVLSGSTNVLGRAMSSTWFRILGPIALAIGAFVATVEAWKTNFMGFGDWLNNIGVGIGNAIPQLKGFLDWLVKIGNATDALIHGRFGEIGSILSGGVAQGADDASGAYDDMAESGKELAKQQQELDKANQQVQSSIQDIIQTIAGLDKKKDRLNLAKALGFDKFRSEVGGLFKGVGDAVKKLDLFGQLQDMFKSGIFDLGGTKGDVRGKGFLKDLTKDWKKNFDQMIKELHLDKGFFDPVLNAIKQGKGKSGEQISLAISRAIIDNPRIKQLLSVYAPELVSNAEAEIKAAQAKIIVAANNMIDINRSNVGTSVDKLLNSRGVGVGQIEAPPIHQIVNLEIKPFNSPGASTLGSGSGGMSGGKWWDNIAITYLQPLFNAGTWANALNTVADPTFWAGVTMQINGFISSSLQRLKPSTMASGNGSGGMSGGKEWDQIMVTYVQPLFNAGTWFNALKLAGSPDFWAGVTQQINTFISTSLSRLSPKAMASGNGTGGMSGGKEWDKIMVTYVQPLFNAGTWFNAIKLAGSPDFWKGVTEQINSFVSSSLSRLAPSNMANGDKSGGMDIGQGTGFSNWISKIQTWLAPIFNVDNWKKAIDTLIKALQPAIAYGQTQLGNARQQIITPSNKVQGNLGGTGSLWGDLPNLPDPTRGALSNFLFPSKDVPGSGGGIGGKWANDTFMHFISADTGGGKADFFSNTKQQWNQMAQEISKINLAIAKSWSKVMSQNITNTKSGASGVEKQYNSMIQTLSKDNLAIAKSWSAVMNMDIKNTKSGASGIQKQWNSLASEMSSIHLAIAKSWSKMMNQNIKNTSAAAKKIESILHSIPDEEVKVNIVTTKTTQLKTTRLAKGGIISAATGYVTNGPELIMVGDNPGGRETIAAIPHNAPQKAMGELNSKFGTGSGGVGSSDGGSLIANFRIFGSELINEKNLTRRIKLTVGENRDKFG